MVEELREAASHPDIRTALVQKISRERVGEELHKMLKGRDPLGSIHLIHSLGIYHEIFLFPPALAPQLSGAPAPNHTSLTAIAILASLLSSADAHRTGFKAVPPLHPLLSPDTSAIPRLYLASALTPYVGLTYSDSKGKTHAAVDAIIRDGLKLGVQAHYSDGIPALFEAAKLLRSPDASKSRVEIGKLRIFY
jgi:tRNA nucleotidyltransferase (CCA-adding enzyme)